MRLPIAAALLLAACSSAPPPKPPALKDATKEPWYAATVAQLAGMDREAGSDFKAGKSDDAAALIQKGELLSKQLLAVPRPTLEAMQAASDLDDLYGRMLLSNHNYGWARLFFQKNLARWKYWTPKSPDTEQRLKQAQYEIERCDKSIAE